MEQKHWAGVSLSLLALLVVSVGGDPDGSGWIAGIGVGVLVSQIVLIWHMWEIRQTIDAAVASLSVPAEPEREEPTPPTHHPRHSDKDSELQLWLRSVTRTDEREESVMRLFNAGDNYALNALLHPMHSDWQRTLPHQIFDATVQDTTGTERWMRMTARGSFRAPLIPAGLAVDLQLAGPTGPGTVICVRWDDPGREMRRWRCWEMATSPGATDDAPRRELRTLRSPVTGGCDRCPERIGGVCPHLLERNTPDGYANIARSLFEYQDWL